MRRVSKILPNNITSFSTYNLNGNLTNLNHTLGASTLADYGYNYDTAGNRTAMDDLSGEHDYTYDKLSQLTQADHPLSDTESYAYDPVGNRLSSSSSSAWSHNAGNMLLDDGNFTYQYLNDCLIQKTDKSSAEVTTYTYDSEKPAYRHYHPKQHYLLLLRRIGPKNLQTN